MELENITYVDKVALNENPDIADINKVKADNMNEIKNKINNNNLTIQNKLKKDFVFGNANIFTYTPTYDCIAVIEVQFGGWGFAGGLIKIGIDVIGDVTETIGESIGIAQGGDFILKQVNSKKIVKLKKDINYTFGLGLRDGSVGLGGNLNQTWLMQVEAI